MSISAQELYELNKEGRSYEILASQNGMTKGAIAGKIFRWKKKNNIDSDFRSRKNQIYGKRTSNPVKKAKVEPTVVPLNMELDDLKNSQCRYPYGEGLYTFCGHPVRENSPYCTDHHSICFRNIRSGPVNNSSNLGSWG